MPIYLVRLRNSNVATLGGAMRSVSRSRRADQVAEVASLRQTDTASREVPLMVGDYKGKILHGGDATPLTGLQLVEMPAEQAEKMARENAQVVVLRDQPLDLIAPQRKAVAATTAKPAVEDLWHLSAIGLAPGIRKKLAVSGKGVTIAVLDTGIDETHPELTGRVAGAVSFDTTGWLSLPQSASEDTHGHGTHVAGLICGATVGVAPGARVWNATMIPGGHGMLSDFVLAMEWCGQQPEIQIANLSAGITDWVDGMQDVVGDLLRVGVLPIVATGNEGANHTRSPGNYSEVMSVGATNRQRKVSSFSSGGRLNPNAHVWIVPDLVAPGEDVTSCVVGGGFEAWSGTSMATPIVSGLAALLLEHYRDSDLNVADLQEMLLETCQDLGNVPERQGRGLIQLHPGLLSAKKPVKKAVKKLVKSVSNGSSLKRVAPKKQSPAVKKAVKKKVAKKKLAKASKKTPRS